MDELPPQNALEALMYSMWCLSTASRGSRKRVREDTARACLRTLAQRDDAIGRNALNYLGLGSRKVSGI